jgi:site-specific DNA recombinase
MTAAIYARYSSENQRPESIDDQISACRKLAKLQSLTVSDEHIYADQAQSGARSDRPALASLMAAARSGEFQAVLVDDLSRLARDNHLMLSIIAELHFEGIRVVSVADGLDSTDEESTLAIQVRGIFNELQLRDLKKKTLRGQIGQKERGFFVGEKTFGYQSVPVGEMRMDKKGRPRPEGYKMEIEPKEAAVILRIFTSYADGESLTQIVKKLNEENVPGSIRSAKGWSPATVSRILDNEKYAGRWIWNRTESRRDPRTGRRRRFDKPESEWIVREDEDFRIIPKQLWETVRERRKQMHRTWPGGNGKRGFSSEQGSRQKHFPTHLLAGSMVCASCGATIAQVSGKSGGYYGCLAATKGACENKTPRAQDVGREGDPRSRGGEDLRAGAHCVRPRARRGGDRQAPLRPARHAEAQGSRALRRTTQNGQLRRLHRRGPWQPGPCEGPGRVRAASRNPHCRS